MTAEPQKSAEQESEDDWEREQEAAEQAMLAERVGLVVGGRYKIVRTIGAGGMGGVYEAEHELIGKKVALKCLHKEYTRDRDLVERFKREARAATAIGNQHIIDVTDMGDLPDGSPFLVMEFLSGTTLSGLMEDLGAMRIPRVIHIARQVCDALGAAHEKGIVHRDLKPENVFLTRRGNDPDFVKVLDFGISKIHSGDRKDRGLTRTGMAIGTPTYMSPEQAQGLRDVDARTDVWAMGVIIYEMLTGHRPFEADSYPMLLMRIVGSEPDPVVKWRKDIPEALSQIVMRCLEKAVGTRMQTMYELESALAEFAGVDRAPAMSPDGTSSPGIEAERASPTMVRGGAKDSSPASIAATQMVPSSRPPPNTASGVRASTPSTATRVGTANDPSISTPGKKERVDHTPVVPVVSKAQPQHTAEIGAVVRKDAKRQERTGELGSIMREGEPSPNAYQDAPAPPKNNTPLMAIGAVVVILLAVGVGWLMSGGGGASVPTPPPTAAVTPPPTSAVATPDPLPPLASAVVAPPAEVRVRISVVPSDATITINDVEFPNPMDAMQSRSLTPVRIAITQDGYRGLERLAIFDSDQNFHFELARGRGVQHVGVTGDEVPEGAARAPQTPPPSTTTGSGHTGSFRDQF